MRIISYEFDSADEVISILQKARDIEDFSRASEVLCAVYVNASEILLAEEIMNILSEKAPDMKVVGTTCNTKFVNGIAETGKRVISFICMESSSIEVMSYDFSLIAPEDAARDFSDKVNAMKDAAAIRMFATDPNQSRMEYFFSKIKLEDPSICLAGGLAADDRYHFEYSEENKKRKFVFSTQVINPGVCAIIFHGPDLHAWPINNYGMQGVGSAHTITSVDQDFFVTEIDGISADDFYRKYLGASVFSKDFVSNVINMPFLVRRENAILPRSILYVNETGGVYLDSQTKVGEQFHFAFGNMEKMLNHSYLNAGNLLKHEPDIILMSMCGTREDFLGSNEQTELDYYRYLGADVLGSNAFGEIEGIGGRVYKTEFSMVAVAMREGEASGRRESRFDMLTRPTETEIFSPMDAITTFLLQTSMEYAELKKRELASEMNKKIELEKAKNEAKSAFLANISHEIRTPINAVLGMNEMIMRTTAEKKTKEYASDIKYSGKTLLSIINDILDSSKIESGKMELVPVEYDMPSLINDLVNMVQKRAEDKGLMLSVTVDSGVPVKLYGDDIRIRQCVTNLLTNAVKYTHEGTVSLSVKSRRIGDDSAGISYSVEDTGIGIKEEDMDKLFKSFERIEEERNRNIEGTGLGMSITTNLLHLMGSSLNVKSEYGKGSVFSFEVEQRIIDAAPIGDFEDRLREYNFASENQHELFTAPEAKILVVDDTDMNLVVIRGLLEETLVQVDTAAGGPEALDILKDNEYDVLLIDHRMPEMDGIELLERIKENKDGKNHGKPCVALTANAVSGIRESYLKAGFDDYLSKPVDPVKLENMLISLIPEEKVHLFDSEKNITDKKMNASRDRKMSSSGDEADGALTDIFSDILGLNIRLALKNCGSPEVFKNAYKRFIAAIPEKSEKIRGYFETGDIENYTILVHSLKSSAALIGATQLSEEAAKLEKAGNSGDTDYIKGNTERVLSIYETYRNGSDFAGNADIANAASKGTEEALSEEAFSEALEAVAEFAEAFDLKSASDVLSNIEKNSLTDQMKDKIKTLRELIRQADADAIVAMKNG